MSMVAQLLGVTTLESVRKWVHQAEVDQGDRVGVSSEESAELKRLKREKPDPAPCGSSRRRCAGSVSRPVSVGLSHT
jgi:transposase-like protein